MGASSSISGNWSSKELGDVAYRSGQYIEAIAYYTEAVNSQELISPEELAKLLCNRSAAFCCIHQYQRACEDAKSAICIQPMWAKPYFRASQALMFRERTLDAAREYIVKAVSLSPNDNGIISLHKKLFTSFQPQAKGLGQIFTWGIGSDGQLGNGCRDSILPKAVDRLRGKHFLDVACGAMHTVAVSAVGEVYSWGNNKYFQCGIHTNTAHNYHQQLSSEGKDEFNYTIPEPILIFSLLGVHIVSVACGAGHTIALSNDGFGYSWGLGKQGQLGLGSDEFDTIAIPTRIQSLAASHRIQAVSCGIAHSFFLLSDGSVRSCGLNNYGQLGQGELSLGENTAVPSEILPVVGMGTVAHIACGGAHTCLVDSAGVVYSCGSNSSGQLGLGTTNDCAAFTRIPYFSTGGSDVDEFFSPKIAFVACGEEFSVAIASDRKRVFSWGLGIAGQLGQSDLRSRSTPALVEGLYDDVREARDVSGVTAGGGTCPVRADSVVCGQGQVLLISDTGAVWTWGLPGDRAQAALQDPSLIIKRPERLASFSSRKKVRRLICGRKHYAIIIVGIYGPYCQVHFDSDLNSCIAGKRYKFQIEARDVRNERYEVGGSVFRGDLEMIDSEDAVVALGLVEGNLDDMNVDIDFDGLNGSYSGQFYSQKTGIFSLCIDVDELPVAGSPFQILFASGSPSANTSKIMFLQQPARAADETVANDSEITLYSRVDNYMKFVVSLNDKYGNRCSNVDKSLCQLFFNFMPSLAPEEFDEQSSYNLPLGEIVCNLHIVPCFCNILHFSVGLQTPENIVHSDTFPIKIVVADSTVSDALSLPSAADIKSGLITDVGGESDVDACSHVGTAKVGGDNSIFEAKTEQPLADSQLASRSVALENLRKGQLTRRRAKEALRVERARIEQEHQRKSTLTKRTGGGFIIKYEDDDERAR